MKLNWILYCTAFLSIAASEARAGIFDRLLRRPRLQTLEPCEKALSNLNLSADTDLYSQLLNQQATTHQRLNTYLSSRFTGLALQFHNLEMAAQAATSEEQYKDLMEQLAQHYVAEGRLQEAASTLQRMGAAERAQDLREQIVRSLKVSQIRFIRRLDFDKHEFNGKQKGKTESWLVETEDGIPALFKPETDFWEDPLKGADWKQKMKGSQAIKEVQGYLDDQIFETHMVPVAVFREGLVSPSGKIKAGSLQYFYRDLLDQHGYETAEALWPGEIELEFSSPEQRSTDAKTVPVWRRLRTGNMNFFDYITDNKDRHADNFKILPGGHRLAIDHAHSHGGPGRRWALTPTLQNIHEFIPDEPVLLKAYQMSDENFVKELLSGRILTSEQAEQAQIRRQRLLQLIKRAGYAPTAPPAPPALRPQEPGVLLPDGKIAATLRNLPPATNPKDQTFAPEYIEEIVRTGLTAAAEILSFYKSDRMTVDRKADASSVTNADLAANRLIVESLERLAPNIPILSEESEIPPFSVRSQWQEFFILDPIDGTSGFINGSDEFTVNIAYIRNGLPEIGVVVVPAKGIVYFAAKGYGTWKQVAGQPPQRVFAGRPPFGNLPILVSSNHLGSSRYKKFFAENGIKSNEVHGLGSSYKFGLVAEGAARAYVRLKGQNEWDVAAGVALYRFSGPAGSEVLPIPFVFNSEDLKVNAFTIGHLSP